MVGDYRKETSNMRLPPLDKPLDGKGKEGNNGKKDKPKKLILNQNNDELFIRSPMEYWDYLHSNKKIDGRKYGLLYFTHYVLSSFHNKEISNDNKEFTYVRMEIMETLQEILERIGDIEKNNLRHDYTDMRMMICECLAILPPEDVLKAGKNINVKGSMHEKVTLENLTANKADEGVDPQAGGAGLDDTNRQADINQSIGLDDLKKKCQKIFGGHIKRYLLDKRISYEELFNLLVLTNSTDFIKNAKVILSIEDKDQTLEVLIGFQVRMQRLDNTFADAEELRKEKGTIIELARMLVALEADELTVYTSKGKNDFLNTPLRDKVDEKFKPSKLNGAEFKTSDTLRPDFQNFVREYVEIFLQEGNYDSELDYWVMALRHKIVTTGNYDESFTFLKALQKVFIKSNDKLFLLRSIRLLLNKISTSSVADNKPLELDQIGSNATKGAQKENQSISSEAYASVQNLFDEAEVPILCLSVINENSEPILVDEACNVLCSLLNNGNDKVQQSLFKTFEENIFTEGFFTYIKDRLESSLEQIKDELSYPLSRRPILEMEPKLIVQRFRGISNQDMIINILQVLKYFCDNCFLKFQNFLRSQITEKLKFNLHSVNTLEKLSDFLTRLTKENPDQIFVSLAKLVEVVLNVLTEFVLGPCTQNQQVMIENRKIMLVVNNILELSLNESTQREKKTSMAKILHQTAIFIESLITGNDNKRMLATLLESINRKSLRKQLLLIYILKVRQKKRLLFLDKYCHLVDEAVDESSISTNLSNCTLDYCKEQKITYFDLMLVNTAFKIFLIIKQLEDKMPGDKSLESLGLQMIVYNSKFDEIRKRTSLLDLDEYNPDPKGIKNQNLNLNLIYKNHKKSSKVHAVSSRKMQYVDDKEVNELSPFKDFLPEFSPNNKASPSDFKIPTHDPIAKTIDVSIADALGVFAHKIAQEGEKKSLLLKFIENEESIFYNEARTFFNSYVASVEIHCKDSIEKVHFQIPYCCRYISDSIKHSMIYEVNRGSDQERIESFFFRFRHYEYEMRRRQRLFEIRPLYFLIKSWKFIKLANFVLIVVLNIMMAFYFKHSFTTSDNPSEDYSIIQEYSLLGKEPTVRPDTVAEDLSFRILTYVQTVAAFLILIFFAYDRYPRTLYARSQNDYFIKESEQLRNTKFEDNLQIHLENKRIQRDQTVESHQTFGKIVMRVVFSWENIYNLVLFIVSVLSMIFFPLLYAVLLFDIVNLSSTLSHICRALVRSWKLLGLTASLGIVVLFFYSVIGFNFFPRDYTHTVTLY